MSPRTRIACVGFAGLWLGCTGWEEQPVPEPTLTTPTASEPGICDPQPAFQRNACLDCHGADVQGGLDLRPDGLEPRLVDVPSSAQGCEGRLLVDSVAPENSQLLRVLTPDSSGRCVLAMPPPPAAVSDEDLACITEWVESLAADTAIPAFEPTPIDAAITKVKRLTTGTHPTADELARVHANPAALRELVREWTETPEFRAVTERTLAQLLQIEPRATDWVMIERRNGAAIPRTFSAMLTESVVRTTWDIVEQDRPLTELYRTDRWAVTTAMLVMMRFADQSFDERNALDRTHSVVPAPADAVPDYTASVASGVWEVPGLSETCRDSEGPGLRPRQLLHLQWGQIDCRGEPDHRFRNDAPMLPDADDTDWRFVQFVSESPSVELDEPPFYDVEAWRTHDDVVHTRLPRTGFMTTPAFLNNWETNPDNEYRVTTNQALIVALGSTFSIGEPTSPPTTEGLDTDHSDPSTDCYGCHRQLDPMRGYFALHFDENWRPIRTDFADPRVTPPFSPSFAFGGLTELGGNLASFGDVLADHPGVATAWAQKLCWIANGRPCRIDDPEFQRVASAFESNGFSYRDLVVELYSSPLVTGLAPTTTHPTGLPVGPKRAEHWCNTVEARGADSCRRRDVGTALGLLPGMSVARAKVDPIVPQQMTVFAVAGLEKACQTLASSEVGGADSPFPRFDAAGSLPRMVEELAGLAPGHERYQPLLDALGEHFTEVINQTADAQLAMESSYVVACSSPDAAALGL